MAREGGSKEKHAKKKQGRARLNLNLTNRPMEVGGREKKAACKRKQPFYRSSPRRKENKPAEKKEKNFPF